jgi:hypothetical protein
MFPASRFKSWTERLRSGSAIRRAKHTPTADPIKLRSPVVQAPAAQKLCNIDLHLPADLDRLGTRLAY